MQAGAMQTAASQTSALPTEQGPVSCIAMALAATSYEVRVAEVLAGSAAPMTAGEILAELQARFGMVRLKKSDINTTLYGSSVYASVSGSTPPKWFVRGTPAEDAGEPYYNLSHLPPIEVVPDDEFAGRPVVIGGETTDRAAVGAAVALALQKGAIGLRCLAAHSAGEIAADVAKVAGAAFELVGGSNGSSREALVESHRQAFEGPPPAGLVLVGLQVTKNYATHHILAAFETRGLPVYLAPVAPEPVTNACLWC